MELLDLVRVDPLDPTGKPWDYVALSMNRSVTLELILGSPDIPWDWTHGVSRNPNLPLAYVVAHPKIPWEHSYIMVFSKYTLEELLTLMSPTPYDWNLISSNPNITMEDVTNHPDKPWNWQNLAENPNLSLDCLLSHRNRFPNRIGYYHLTKNPSITLRDMVAHPEIPWDVPYMSYNPSTTEQDVEEHSEIEWDYTFLSCNPSISLEYIRAHPDKPWVSKRISGNSGLTLQQLLRTTPDRWTYRYVLMYVHKSSYTEHLRLISQEQSNPHSRLSHLPKDMLNHYLHLYFEAWRP